MRKNEFRFGQVHDKLFERTNREGPLKPVVPSYTSPNVSPECVAAKRWNVPRVNPNEGETKREAKAANVPVTGMYDAISPLPKRSAPRQ
jgi:hypothetical protein